MKNLKDTVNIIREESLVWQKEILPPNVFDSYLQSIRRVRRPTFRVNTLKASKQEIMTTLRQMGISVSEFTAIPGCFIANQATDRELLKLDITQAGKIYLQSISSQMPPLILEPKPGETILDIAAAPGSKTSQICAFMQNQGVIDAVEPDFIRVQRLEHNLKLLGATIVNVHQSRGESFCNGVENKYDRVLVDAPCSGEGRFCVYDKSSYAAYRADDVNKFHKIQAKLLKAAMNAVKPGGTVLYSTCTLNRFENEEVLQDALSNFNCKIVPLPKNLTTLTEALTPISSTPTYPKLRKDISNAIRIVPSTRVEGFFLAKIIKDNV
ncbi:MAG: RsmB/NOP family class I SAM-dependent RNA methyltransferase [Spirochaetales bacterium]|nr:RsmB/NOP family class I SAM-dependent RNA methyltransferase [Spirochaetales bacterium]